MAGRTYNHVVLVGRIGADPNVKSTANGKKVCTFNLATNRPATSGKDEITDWHRIELWDKLANIAEKYLRKGSQVLIEGRIAYEQWEKNGVKQYLTKIVASNMMMLDSRKSSDSEVPAVTETTSYSDDISDFGEEEESFGEFEDENEEVQKEIENTKKKSPQEKIESNNKAVPF